MRTCCHITNLKSQLENLTNSRTHTLAKHLGDNLCPRGHPCTLGATTVHFGGQPLHTSETLRTFAPLFCQGKARPDGSELAPSAARHRYLHSPRSPRSCLASEQSSSNRGAEMCGEKHRDSETKSRRAPKAKAAYRQSFRTLAAKFQNTAATF